MKYHLIKFVFLSVLAYTATAQSVLSLVEHEAAEIESYGTHNQLLGNGLLSVDSDKNITTKGSLLIRGGQNTGYSGKFKYNLDKDNNLLLDLLFYQNPSTYSKNVALELEGGTLSLPAKPVVGMELPEVKGTFTGTLANKPFVKEVVTLSGRKITGAEELTYRGKTYTAYLLVANYSSERELSNKIVEVKEQITQWYIPFVGIVKSSQIVHGITIIFKLK